MKTRLFIALTVLAAVSCAKETQPSVIADSVTIFATSQTKTVLKFDNSVVWDDNESISVFASDGSNNLFSSADKTAAQASFSGEVPHGTTPQYAVYPYSASNSFNADKFTLSIPSTQFYNKIKSFGKECNVSIGEITDTAGVFTTEMKNICGLVSFILPGSNVKSVKLEAAETAASLTGTVQVSYNSGNPSVNVVDGKNFVELSRQNGSNLPGNELYLSVLPGTYNGIKLTVTFEGDSTQIFQSANALTVDRAKISRLGILTLSGVQKEYISFATDRFNLGTKNITSQKEGVVDEFVDKGLTYGLYAYGTVSDKTAAYRYWTNNGLYLYTKNAFFRFPKVTGKRLYAFHMMIGGTQAQTWVFADGTSLVDDEVYTYAMTGCGKSNVNKDIYGAGTIEVACADSEAGPSDGYYYLHNNTGSGTANNFIKTLTMYYNE